MIDPSPPSAGTSPQWGDNGLKRRLTSAWMNGVDIQATSVNHGWTKASAIESRKTGTGSKDISRSQRASAGLTGPRSRLARWAWANSTVSMPLTAARLRAKAAHDTGLSP